MSCSYLPEGISLVLFAALSMLTHYVRRGCWSQQFILLDWERVDPETRRGERCKQCKPQVTAFRGLDLIFFFFWAEREQKTSGPTKALLVSV